MFRYLRSAPQVLRSCLAPSRRRLSRKEEFLRPLQLERLEDRSLLAGINLNDAINSLLSDPFNPPSPSEEFTYADITVGTSVGSGTADIELKNVTLKFPDLAFEAGQWTGNVTVAAQTGVLFPGLYDIAVDVDVNEADLFGVVGNINLSVGNSTSHLELDDFDAEKLGWPQFLDINFSQPSLNFTDFRQNDNLNSLKLQGDLTGFDTGNDSVNALLSADNPLFGLSIQGFASTTLNIKQIEDAAEASILPIDTAVDLEFAHAVVVGLDGMGGQISGKLFKVGDFSATFIFNNVTVDPDGTEGPLPEETDGYLAVQGSFSIGDEKLGGRSTKFDIAFAISELGPLQFFVSGGPIKRFEPTTGLSIEEVHLGVRFNTTIEELQTETDFQTNAATVAAVAAPGTGFIVTMTVPDHDFEVGDEFRVREAGNSNFNSLEPFEVLSVNDDVITYKVDTQPGAFIGSAKIIRLTIKNPLDLRDEGLASGISVPGSLATWQQQLDGQVTNQILLGDSVWEQLFQKAVFGGGATISIDPIPDTVMMLKADLLIDTDLRILVNGTMSLTDGFVEIPATLYADLSKLFDGSGKYLFLAEIPKVEAVLDEPLVVIRGQASFQAVKAAGGQIIGFTITEQGAIDLNIPQLTTITLEGTETLAFTFPSAKVAQIDLSFTVSLSETNIGAIGTANGKFHVKIDGDKIDSPHPLDGVELWGAALLTTDFKFLEKYGLFANASGLLRINSTSSDKENEVLLVNGGSSLSVALPARSVALRLDGNVDFRIDFDKDNTFESSESMAVFNGIFVFELTPAQGFNVAIFKETTPGVITSAALQLGPPDASGTRFLGTAEALGFLAIRSNGVAAHLYVGLNSKLPLGLAELKGAAVLVINTTGVQVDFTVPGGASDPNRPSPGTILRIPAAAPSKPADILGAGGSATNPQFEALKTGSPTWVAQSNAGPYGVLFVKSSAQLLGVLDVDVAGYVLLSTHVVSLEVNYKAERNFLNLVSGKVSGSLFFSSQGEFVLDAHGDVQLGPDGFNIAGTANLLVSYLDSDLKGSAGVDPKKLEITGDLSVKATVFYVSMGTIGLDVAYKEPSITVGVTVPVPDIAWTSPDPVFGVSWPYPTIVDKKYTFTVGTLTVNPDPPPPVYLASNMGGGVLRLNVGLNATARNYNIEEKDEAVAISRLSAGTNSGEKILITMFGITQEYDNVASISADMGDGNDFLSINSGVTVPVVAHLGVGTDTLTNKSAAFVTAYGEGDRDSLTGGSGIDWLYGGGDNDTIDGGAGADWIEGGTENDFLIGGDGIDTIKGDDGQDLIAGDLGGFTGTTTGIVFSSAASASGGADTIYGGQGADIIFGGSGGDTIYGDGQIDTLLGGDGQATIGSAIVVVALALGSDGADDFRWNVGNGNDIIDGQAGSDTLNIFGTDGSAEQLIVSAKGAGFTAAVGTESLSVDGVEVSNIEGRGGSDSFTVNDLTGSVLQQINLKLGSDSVQDAVVVNGSAIGDVFTIAPFESALRVQKTGGVTIDVFDTSSTSGGDTITLDTKAGADTINVRGTLAGTLTTVHGGDGADLIQVGSNATAATNTGGNLNGIAGGLAIAGDGALDVLSLDDTGDTSANTGTLTATQITGLGMGSTGIAYAGVETLVVSLGSGGDTFTVQNTAGTANSINTGNGSDTVTVNATGSGSLILNGQADSDTFNINLGSLAAPVSVADTGASGSDALNINGLAGANNIVLDHTTIASGTELVNYTGIESLRIDTHDEADAFIIKDNGARTTIYSGIGDDEFTIGPAVNEDGEVLDANLNGTNTDEQAIKGTSLWMTINGGDGNDDFEVNRNTGELFLNGENGDDVFVLNTLITGGDSTVDGGGNADVITYLQNAPVYINGGDGFDTIIVNGSKLDDFFIITGTTIEVVGSRKVDYLGIESLTANGRKGMDTFTVDTTIDGLGNPLATSALQMLTVDGQQDNDLVELRGMLTAITATFRGGLGDDTFNLRSLAPSTVTVNAIDGPVAISGDDGQDTVNVYDTCDSIANAGTLTSTTLTGLGMESGVTYGTLEALRISLGKGGNTFTIQSTHIGLTFLNSGSGADTVHVRQIQGTTTVNAEAGNDTIKVGSLAPSTGGSVNQIAAALIVNGGVANLDTLNVDDTGDATPNDGVLTATTLTGLGMGSGITYSNLELLNVSLGAGGNSFNVRATAAGTATTLNSGNGNDALTIDSNGASAYGTVNSVISSLTINGQGGKSVLTMEDFSDTTGDKVHVTPTQIGAAADDTFFGAGGSLTYSELDQVTLNMSQAVSPDTIYLTPSRLGTEFFIRGRDPQTPMQRAQLPGDALYQDFTGLTAAERLGVRLNATGLNNPADPVFNVWSIPGHGKVNYKQIEKMDHVQTVAVGANVGSLEPRVRVIDAETGVQKLSFLAFAPKFKGGVRVAVGDVNGDAIPDIITSAGPGGGPEVRVFNGATGARFTEPIGDFFAFQQGSATTTFVAVADFNMDGLADIVTGSDSGDPIIKVFDSYKLLTGKANPVMSQFTAYDRHITGGARLAVGDLTGDGVPDIAAAPVAGLNAEVRISATTLSANQATVTHKLFTSFIAFPNYNRPINIAVGDVNGDRRADIVVGTDPGNSSLARIYNGATLRAGSAPKLLAEFAPFGKGSDGVRVALVDVDGDGVNELLTSSALTGSKVKPKAYRLQPNGPGGLTPTAIDAVFAGYASDPFFQGAQFLGGGN